MSAISGGGDASIASIVDSEAAEGRGGWLIIAYNRFPKSPVEINAQVLCAGSGQAVAASTRRAVRKRMEQHVSALIAKLRAERAAAR
jgi:hypothetical protein